MLQSHRKPYHSRMNPGCFQLRVGQLPMGCAGRMQYAGPDITDMYFVGGQLQRVHETNGVCPAAFDIEGDDAAGAFQILLRQLVVRIAF